MNIKDPQCHHHKLNIVQMRVTPLTVLICTLVAIIAVEIFW